MTKSEEYKRGGRGPTAAALQHHRGTTGFRQFRQFYAK